MIVAYMMVFNEERHVEAAIQSVLQQTYRDFQLVVSDNHSTDGSAAAIMRAVGSDPRVTVVMPPNHMSSMEHYRHLWGHVLPSAGDIEFSIHIGGHDLWQPDLLEVLVARADLQKDAAIVYTDACEIDDLERVTHCFEGRLTCEAVARPFRPLHVLVGLTHNTLMFGLWNERLRRRVPLRLACTGADHLVIAELSLEGSIIHAPGSMVRLRRASNAGNWNTYVEKHLSADLRSNRLLDFVGQLDWVVDIAEKAVLLHPLYERAAMRNMLTSSLLAAYVARYWSHIAMDQDALGTLLGNVNFQEFVSSHAKGLAAYRRLSESLQVGAGSAGRASRRFGGA
jgi:hypothetical protein